MIAGLNPDVPAHNEFLNWLTALQILVEVQVERRVVYREILSNQTKDLAFRGHGNRAWNRIFLRWIETANPDLDKAKAWRAGLVHRWEKNITEVFV